MLKDSQGRIKLIGLDEDVHGGHSVCNGCGKDMPKCWDVVCYKCNKTFCYDCVDHNHKAYKKVFDLLDIPMHWYCLECIGIPLLEIDWFQKSGHMAIADVVYAKGIGLCSHQPREYGELHRMADMKGNIRMARDDQLFLVSLEARCRYWEALEELDG